MTARPLTGQEQIYDAFVNALTLHKERIRRLQEMLCECTHRDLFQADLHDESCPVYIAALAPSAEEETPQRDASGGGRWRG